MSKRAGFKDLAKEVWSVYVTLLKVMLPAIVIVKVLDYFGGTALLAQMLAPLMGVLGLPDTMGVVWASAILTNVYTAMVVFVDAAANSSLTVAQASVVGILILISHSVPVEGAVAKMIGVGWWATIALRVLGGFVLAYLVHVYFQLTGLGQDPAVILWQGSGGEQSLSAWLLDQVILFIGVFFIIAALMGALHVLRLLGLEKWMQYLLSPLLRLLSIGREATNITIVGITLGMSFGAGLLISEVKRGKIKQRDIVLSVCFLSLAHSLIEDTLLVLLLGADLVAILWLRLLFAVVVVAMIALWMRRQEAAKGKSTVHQSS